MPETSTKPSPAGLVYRLPENQTIKIIGLGGIGSIVVQFLSLFLDSNLRQPTRLVLIDGDEFTPSNAPRTTFQQLGNKAEVKAAETLSVIRSDRIAIVPIPRYVTQENVGELIRNGDLLMLCCDNHPTRKLISDHCEKLSEVILISGGNEGVDPPRELGTYGNVQIAVRRSGKNLTAPITRFHPEIAGAQGRPPSEMDCIQQAASTPQILITNLAVATAMLCAFLSFVCDPDEPVYQEIKLDVLEARMLPQLAVGPEGGGTKNGTPGRQRRQRTTKK